MLSEYFKFGIVRDPYSRTLTAYLDKILNRARQSRRPLRFLKSKYGTETPDFEQFCEYLADDGLCDDNLWAPQLDGLVMPPNAFGHIARFEKLNEELNLISWRIFGMPLGKSCHFGPKPTGSSAHMADHYTLRAREIVREIKQCHFEAFGYEP